MRLHVVPMSFIEARRKALIRLLNWIAAFFFSPFLFSCRDVAGGSTAPGGDVVKLPSPEKTGVVSVEGAIARRRTVRTFLPKTLEMKQLGQLLWAAHGITEKLGFRRAAPSAGALYPMDVYVVVGQGSVVRIDAGVYHYEPAKHALSFIKKGDLRSKIARASLFQMWMAKASLSFVITAEYGRITGKYGDRGVRYAMMEAGHIGQNLFLQAQTLGLSAGIVGAFRDKAIIDVMDLPPSHEPLLIMPVGFSE